MSSAEHTPAARITTDRVARPESGRPGIRRVVRPAGERPLGEAMDGGVAPAASTRIRLGSTVQRRAVSTAEAAQPAVAAGVAAPSAPLPHMDAIQKAFGRHDVSSVQAHTGPAAAAGAAAIGAVAYTSGSQVVLAATDVATVAHEAAHVVQQRSGVTIAPAAAERHADQIAAAVAAGESAEPALDEFVAGRPPAAPAAATAAASAPAAGHAPA